ncbi:hypothetical protein HGP28_18430 [Vibrio sp. SM6]|uniref:Uncharacterized protein n=1 Tax=Vibrio agarilyticus TaxID=2726741 RepID=A0A7X8TU40_9VIBR|nr:hypothetical protein [Vibrio agarilyticus]NLS14839.1 hypothetical protein [Vibrio agarilyticus]
MSKFVKEYKRTNNSILAYKNTVDCSSKTIREISEESFQAFEDVYEDLEFFIPAVNKRSVLKNVGKVMGAMVSLGGSFMLEVHNKHYADMYEAIYKPAFNRIKTIERSTNETLSSIGADLSRLKTSLKPVEKILKSKSTVRSVQTQTLSQFKRFNSGFNTSLNVGFGGLVGGTTALGAWGLVSLIGSASTGTAISSLSGVAATNATLAWFGGGSLATGGAGMAGGFWVLGGILVAPMVFFSTKSSYKKIDKVKEQKETLIQEADKLISYMPEAEKQLLEARKQADKVNTLLKIYLPIIEKELKVYKSHCSFFRDLFGLKMRPEQEISYQKLNLLTHELLKRLGMT